MKGYTQAENQKQILGHPVGLFVLFFTEMWERFSYYGMRAILILFLMAQISKGGWGWTRTEATTLFGWYVMLVYFMPLLGGWIADNKWGHVKTVIVGASIITLGHLSMAVADLKLEQSQNLWSLDKKLDICYQNITDVYYRFITHCKITIT